MRPRGALVSKWFLPARAHVMPRPVGVVGIIVPWNYPLFLAIGPLVAALVAGNRAMVKLSENSRHLCALLMEQALTNLVACDRRLKRKKERLISWQPSITAPLVELLGVLKSLSEFQQFDLKMKDLAGASRDGRQAG
jgi:hypothetical protein